MGFVGWIVPGRRGSEHAPSLAWFRSEACKLLRRRLGRENCLGNLVVVLVNTTRGLSLAS